MANWTEVEAAAPELAKEVRAILDAHRHKVLATLRADGSPRVSGIETTFIDGELYLGGMTDARKSLDLRWDPRLALHSGSPDPPEDPATWQGDAKLTGRAVEITDAGQKQSIAGQGSYDLFRADVTELVFIRPGDPADHLLIDFWREGAKPRRIKRHT